MTENGSNGRFALAYDAVMALAAVVSAVFMAAGRYGGFEASSVGPLIALGSLLLLSLGALMMYFFSSERSPWRAAPLAFAWIVAGSIALEMTGGGDSPLYPLTYLFAAVLGAYGGVYMTAASLAVFIGLEGAVHLYRAGMVMPWGILVNGAGLLAVAGTVGAFFRSERRLKDSLEESLAVYSHSKDNFHSPVPGDEFRSIREEGRREQLRESIVNLQDALHHVLGDLRDILRAHTAILFTFDRRRGLLRFRDAVTESEHIDRGAVIGEGEGILGWVYREKEALRLTNYTHPPENLVYYGRDEKIQSLLAVPIMRNSSGAVEGLLVVDSPSEAYFSKEDEKLVWLAARHAMKEIETAETRQRELSEAKVSHALYMVSEILNASINLQQVLDATMGCVAKIVDADQVVLAIYDRASGTSSVLRAGGIDADGMEGQAFSNSESLVGWVTSPERYLFYPDFKSRRIQKPIFGRGIRPLRQVGTFFCYPLVSASELLGSISLSFRNENALSEYERNAITTLARMAATSISNADLHERVALMATTDGLTGLYNHRRFQERLAERIEEARRHPTKHTLAMLDIDHFKSVNDTHGHPMGDEVLRRLAALLKESVRNIDIAARYGGEEFVLLLSNTDRKGALLLAERIRKNAKKMKFESEEGSFHISVSIGVATFPADARTKEKLVERADQALYHAKENGRDRVVPYDEIRPDEPTGPRLVAERH